MATKNESPYKPFSGPFQSNPNDFRQYLQEQKQKQAQQKKEQEEKQKNSSGGWLHAPYNIIVEPHKTKDGKTEGGGNYEEARKKYDELRARVVDTGEASSLRKAWGSTPQIELKNGKLTLKGSKEFLESSTAKQLRDVFKEMKGKTYNTEALNKQVEAWNADLQKMSDTYLANLEGYNALNQAVASTYSMQGSENIEFKPYSFNEYLKIANSMRLGKESNAANLDDLIFVGYEWDDNGNRKEKWVKAKDFYEEFNSIADKDKRAALRSLITQSQNGDAGAMSKLYYLTGGKDTPANVTYGAVHRINDFFDTFTKNAYVGLSEAADFVTTYVPVFNTMRLTGRAVNAASEGGWNWDKFFEADDTRKMIDEYEDLVTWENAYRMELTPGSTQAASIAGSVIGGALGMAYSIWAGGAGNEAAVQGVSRAISSAGNALRQTGNFVEYTYTINVESGKLQQVRVMSNGMQLGTVPIGAAATGGSVSQSVFIPTALVEKFPNFSAKLAEMSAKVAQMGARSKLMMQFGNMTEAGQNIARVTSTAGKGSILGAADIAKLRMQSRGLQTAINLYILGNESAIRHVDQYFRRTQEGEDLGDMGQYLIDNVGRDVIIGGAMYGAGMAIRGLRNVAKNSKIPASRDYEVYETMAVNSQSGFYNAGSKYNAQPLMLGTGGPTIDTDVARTVGTIMTVNGEPFFVSPTTSGLVSSAIPGSELAGQAFGFVSSNKVNTVTVEPTEGGFNVVTTSIPNDGGTSITTKSFYENLDEANAAAKKAGVPSVNAKTIANSDMAVTGNIIKFDIGGLSTIDELPTGVSRVEVTPLISYYRPNGYLEELAEITREMSPELKATYDKTLAKENIDELSAQIYNGAGLFQAPTLFAPLNKAGAIELAKNAARVYAVQRAYPNSTPVFPVQKGGVSDRELADKTIRIKELDADIKGQKEQVKRDKKDLEDILPKENAEKIIPELDYETRKALAKNFVKNNPDYIVVYRNQNTGVDDWYSNGTGHGASDVTKFESYGSDKGDLTNAVWLTTDEAWVEGPEKATAGSNNGAPDNTVVIPVKKSLIVDGGGEHPTYDPALGEADMTYYDAPVYSIRRFSELNDGKIVLTRATQHIQWENDRDYYISKGQDLPASMRNRLNPKYYSKQELVLFKDLQPNILSEGEQLMLGEYNKQNSVSPRTLRRYENNLATSEKILAEMEAERAALAEDIKANSNDIVVTENGLPRKWFSNMDDAVRYKDELGTRSVYKVDDSQIVLDRPPVTMDNIYYPAVRGANGVATIDEIDMGGAAPNTTDAIAKFNDAMASLPLLKDSPEDYAQGVLDVVQQVKAVYNEVSRFVDMDKTYEEYARQIAEGAEQPTVNDYAKETLEPLSNMLTALGKYFDPSGKSLTKEFYLPTGGKSTKLMSVEDAIAHPEKTVDVDTPVDASFDNILVDPLRIGSSGFWEKRTGELFLDEDGNFTMAKSGSLEENLIAYTVSALTRGENRLSVAANNEVARSKFDKNRNPITSKQALDGLKLADTYRARVRAAQLKNHKSIKDLFGNKELEKLKANYTDKEIVDAIDDAYKQKNFSKELNPVFRINEAAVELGYRQTLQISNLPGSGIREGLNSGFRGFSNLIRKAQHINVTGAKYVMRNNEYVCVGFGLPENMLSEYGAVASEKAVNLGDTVNLLFNPSRAAVTMYEDIRNSQQQWLSNGGWEMMNKLESYATSYFPLIRSPKYAAQRLASELGRNLDAYSDPQALWLANAASIESWVNRYAMENLNAAIQMSDISKIDERTTNTLNDIITTASVGTPVYSSNIVSFIQRTAYQATLWGNGSPMVGNLMSEPMRLIDYYGVKTFTKSFKGVISPKERARIKNIIGDLPSRFDDRPELVGLAAKAKSKLGTLFEFVETAGMTPLQKSEELKNLWFWKAAEINAKELFPNDKVKQIEHTLRMFNDTAIAGGMGTNPSMAAGSIGRLATVLKTFTIRNWDDFIEATERVGRGELGTRKWQRNRRSEDNTYNRYTSGNKQSFNKTAAFRFAGGSILRRYLLWLLVLGPLGRSIWDALGGDPTGLTENFSRGLYDDESTEYDEGMQPIDNFINMIPTGFILGTLKDIYFAARRAGVQTQNFLGIPDFEKDGRFQKDLRQHLPAGVVTRRLGDMLELMDRGYSTNSYGNKTYAAPESLADVFKGFLLGKAATTNAQAYNKYRYGSVDIWGDLFEGDWLDFAMSANPFASMGAVKFDSTRKDYTGVFRGGTNDIPTMQAAIADLRDRNKKIIDDYNKNLEAYTGEFQGLSTEDKKKLAIKKREKAIDTFTEDVTRLVDAFEDAGHSLSDKQINTMMWLFDFNEGDEETSDYTVAQQRYVEAGLPDVSPAVQTAKEKDGKVETQNYFDRSLIYQNAVQGVYGAGRGAAKAVKETLNEFKDVYKEYKKAVGDLQDKVFKKGISASEKKQRSKELEKVQNEYLEKLYAELTPVINKYGTSILSNNDVVAELQPYMSSMIPYSSIRKYGETFSSGNDIVWGQLSDWIQHRWGVGSPKEKSDQEVLDTINKIKALRNAGKVAQSKSEARALLERVARGSVKIRTKDLTTLRKLLNE